MKTYIDFLKEGVEGYSFREVVDNLDEEQFESAAEAYHEYRMQQHFGENKEFYCRKGKIKGERCKMQCLRCSQIDSNG